MNPCLMVTHNALELTRKAVDSVFSQDVSVDFMVVDNGSTDGTLMFLRNRSVQLYYSGVSLGVSRAWNYGLRYFFELGAEYVWVVNNDAVYRTDCYRELISDGGLFVTGVGVNQPQDIQCEFVKNVRPHPDFSCFLIRREVWEKIGPFDDSMALYASDADYHLRMHTAGIFAYTIGMPFYHVASGTIKNATPEEAQAIRWQADRDRETFERKWGCKIGSKEYYDRFGSEAPCPAGT